jgi:hypothetical protein
MHFVRPSPDKPQRFPFQLPARPREHSCIILVYPVFRQLSLRGRASGLTPNVRSPSSDVESWREAQASDSDAQTNWVNRSWPAEVVAFSAGSSSIVRWEAVQAFPLSFPSPLWSVHNSLTSAGSDVTAVVLAAPRFVAPNATNTSEKSADSQGPLQTPRVCRQLLPARPPLPDRFELVCISTMLL